MDDIEATGRAHLATIKKLGGQAITLEDWKQNVGSDWRQLYAESGVQPSLFGEVLSTFKEEFRQYSHLVRPYAGTIEALEDLSRQGLLLAIVSNQQRDVLLELAAKFDLLRFFTTIVAAEDTPEPKPSPEALRYVLRKMKLWPAETVLVEDMQEGIRMGLQVGMVTIGISSELQQDLSRAHFRINNLSSISDCLKALSLDGTTIPSRLNEYYDFYEERYRKKTTREIVRITSWYHADNLAFAKELISWGVFKPGDRIADVGCGLSVYANYIRRICKCTSVQIDISHRALLQGDYWQSSTNRDKQTGFPIQADAAKLPISESALDVIICSEVFEHLIDGRSVLQEFHRALKPRGFLILAIPNSPVYTASLFRPLGKVFDKGGHVRDFDDAEIASLLNSSNFELRKIRHGSYFLFWAVFTLERSSWARRVDEFLRQHDRIGRLVEKLLEYSIFAENRVGGGWAKFGMHSLYLAQRK